MHVCLCFFVLSSRSRNITTNNNTVTNSTSTKSCEGEKEKWVIRIISLSCHAEVFFRFSAVGAPWAALVNNSDYLSVKKESLEISRVCDKRKGRWECSSLWWPCFISCHFSLETALSAFARPPRRSGLNRFGKCAVSCALQTSLAELRSARSLQARPP